MSKIDSLVAYLEKHNEGLAGSKAEPLKVEQIVANLAAIGGASDEVLRDSCKYEDLEECGVPRLLARHIVESIFREKKGPEAPPLAGALSTTKIKSLPHTDLLAAYIPGDDGKITKRLKEISKGLRCIVFTDDGLVDVTTSMGILDAIKIGHAERKTVQVEGRIREIYAVGQLPDRYVDENPMYPGRPLFPGETCDQTNRSWAGVGLEARQLIYLIRKSEGKPSSMADVVMLQELAVAGKIAEISALYPHIALKLDELKKTGQTPTLKVKLVPQKITPVPSAPVITTGYVSTSPFNHVRTIDPGNWIEHRARPQPTRRSLQEHMVDMSYRKDIQSWDGPRISNHVSIHCDNGNWSYKTE